MSIPVPNSYFATGEATLRLRFLKRIGAKPAEGCWEWLRPGTGGYGRISAGRVSARGNRVHDLAHRVAYRLFVGPIPDGMRVLHRCDNPPCVRPDHLFLGTHADNMADMAAKGRRRTGPRVLGPTCKRGHDRATYTGYQTGRPYCRRCHTDREIARQRRLRGAA